MHTMCAHKRPTQTSTVVPAAGATTAADNSNTTQLNVIEAHMCLFFLELHIHTAVSSNQTCNQLQKGNSCVPYQAVLTSVPQPWHSTCSNRHYQQATGQQRGKPEETANSNELKAKHTAGKQRQCDHSISSTKNKNELHHLTALDERAPILTTTKNDGASGWVPSTTGASCVHACIISCTGSRTCLSTVLDGSSCV